MKERITTRGKEYNDDRQNMHFFIRPDRFSRNSCTAYQRRHAGRDEWFFKSGISESGPRGTGPAQKSGEQLGIGLITGANAPWLDELLGSAELITKKIPMCASRVLASQINAGKVVYVEQMSRMPRLLRNKCFGDIDVAVVEALAVTEEGIIPTTAACFSSHYLEAAKEIIVEVNRAQPEELFGVHDIFVPKAPPEAEPIPILKCQDRIGTAFIPFDVSRISCVVETNIPEDDQSRAASTPELRSVAEKLIGFLKTEYASKYNGWIPPIQMGFGNLTTTVAEVLLDSDLTDLQFYCGGADESLLKLLLSGKASVVSTCGIAMNDRVRKLLKEIPDLRDKLIIRNSDMTNNPEVTARLGIIAVNTGIEVDIYGNVNASHIGGSRVVNGIGGGAGFARNSGLSVVMITSRRKGGAISNIVPMVSHQDICGHDVDVYMTENGVADVRGLDDLQTAERIISNCAPEEYKKQLFDYLETAKKAGGHHPQDPRTAFEWFTRLKETGSMLER